MVLPTALWAHKVVFRDFISVKSTGKTHRESILVNMVDWGAVPQFLFRGNPTNLLLWAPELSRIGHTPLRSARCLLRSCYHSILKARCSHRTCMLLFEIWHLNLNNGPIRIQKQGI